MVIRVTLMLLIDIALTVGLLMGNWFEMSTSVVLVVGILLGGFSLALLFSKGWDQGRLLSVLLIFVGVGLILANSDNGHRINMNLINGEQISGELAINDEGYVRNYRYFYAGKLHSLKVYGAGVHFQPIRVFVYTAERLIVPEKISFIGRIVKRRGHYYVYVDEITGREKLKAPLSALKQKFLEQINRFPALSSNFLAAILLGRRWELGWDTIFAFKRAGLIHLLAISGLHIGILFLLFRVLLFPLAPLSRLWRDVVALILLLAYVAMIGFIPSALRAYIMIAVLILTFHITRVYNPLNSLAVAYFVIVVFNPQSIYNIGFQLSFSAVLSILLFYEYFKAKVKNRLLAVTLAVQILTLPLTAYYFHYIPLFWFIGNLIFVPIFSILLSAGLVAVFINALFSVPWLSVAINKSVLLFLEGVKYLGLLRFAALPVFYMSLWPLVFYFLGVLSLKLHGRRLAVLSFMVAIASYVSSITPDAIYFFNKGAFLFIPTSEESVVVDLSGNRTSEKMLNFVNYYFPKSTVLTASANTFWALTNLAPGAKAIKARENTVYKSARTDIMLWQSGAEVAQDSVALYFLRKKEDFSKLSGVRPRRLVVVWLGRKSTKNKLSRSVYFAQKNKPVMINARDCGLSETDEYSYCLSGMDAVIRVRGAAFSFKRRNLWLNI